MAQNGLFHCFLAFGCIRIIILSLNLMKYRNLEKKRTKTLNIND